MLIDFISVGCSVLLSDVDVLWLQNPFPHGLYRDADVEGMSDGWDHPTVFGHNAGDGHFRMHARNSGMFFLQVRGVKCGVGVSPRHPPEAMDA